ncbi:hypothetical protein D9757_006494 [Collybiopsis confluens]|uniref:Leucine carboxyl methyltransferase 1 n=1 Tax=Collybiopsis confluens TaxID=2823264 RepID=A0A8H5HJG4_9AGAR|nr:hypothetical protein D9757_006494 [Collybiopsis confluens]
MLPPPPSHQGGDAPIRLTDNDAALAKLSAARLGYLSDPFIKHFVPRASFQPSRPPLINIGTFVRTVTIDDLVEQWIKLSNKEGKRCQIVSLGAGSDTRFWRLATGPQNDGLSTYIEVDFPENTMKKAMAIKKSKDLSVILGSPIDVKLGGTALSSPRYQLFPADLRQDPNISLKSLTTAPPPLNPSLPTLLICECVLVYMQPEESNCLLQWFQSYFASTGVLGTIVYEMFGLGDSFGRVMVSNLKVGETFEVLISARSPDELPRSSSKARNVSLPGADPFPSYQSLPSRFLNLGYTTARALTLKEIRRSYVEPEELDRISKLEMLDEIEELDLVLEHYAITWGLSLTSSSMGTWSEWGLVKREWNAQDD